MGSLGLGFILASDSFSYVTEKNYSLSQLFFFPAILWYNLGMCKIYRSDEGVLIHFDN